MTMDRMVEYLENRGFKAKKRYISEKRCYEFSISKDGKATVKSLFEYPEHCDEPSKDMRQRNFLDSIIASYDACFNSGVKSVDTDRIYLTTSNTSDWVLKHYEDYCKKDIDMTKLVYKNIVNSIYGTRAYRAVPEIKDVIFNDPATIVFWADGTKTVVKCQEDDEYDPEKGMAMAIAKKALGNRGNYYNEFGKWLDPYYEKEYEKLNTPIETTDRLANAFAKVREDIMKRFGEVK